MSFSLSTFQSIACKAAVIAALAASASLPLVAQNLRVVNGQPIPMSRLQDVQSMGPQPVTPEQTREITERLIDMEVFSQEAKRRGLENSELYQKRIALAQQEVLTQALEADIMKTVTVTEAQAQADYDANVAAAKLEYKVRHILLAPEDEKLARDLVAQIKKGGDFAALAQKHSKDTGSAANGGDLGWNTISGWVPEFANAVRTTPKGAKSTAPIKSQFGWHILWVEDQRKSKTDPAKQFPQFKDIKDRVIESLKQQQVVKMMRALRDSAKIQ